jgi:hypothetical protein
VRRRLGDLDDALSAGSCAPRFAAFWDEAPRLGDLEPPKICLANPKIFEAYLVASLVSRVAPDVTCVTASPVPMAPLPNIRVP